MVGESHASPARGLPKTTTNPPTTLPGARQVEGALAAGTSPQWCIEGVLLALKLPMAFPSLLATATCRPLERAERGVAEGVSIEVVVTAGTRGTYCPSTRQAPARPQSHARFEAREE